MQGILVIWFKEDIVAYDDACVFAASACVFAFSAPVFAVSAPVFAVSAPVFAVSSSACVLQFSVSVFICCNSDFYAVDNCKPKLVDDKLVSDSSISIPFIEENKL